MGRYIDWADVANKFPVVSRGQSAPDVNSHSIIMAEAEIDGRLATHYTVPFSNNNLTVRELASIGTYLRMGILRDEQLASLRQEYEEKIMRLKMGEEAMLSVTDSGTVVTTHVSDTLTSAIASNTEDYHPVFGMGDIVEFEVSSWRLDDEENDRDL